MRAGETHDAAESQYMQRAERLMTLLQSDFGVPRSARTVIAVAGESGSGKSVTAIDLAALLNRAGIRTAIIHQDNYFVRPPRTNHEHRLMDLGSVGPGEVQLDLIEVQLRAFHVGDAAVAAPVVDYPGNRFLVQTLDFSVTNVLVVEGTYALFLDGADIRIFLEATHEDSVERRRERNRDIDAPITATILDIEHRLIAPQVARADIVISRTYEIARRR